MAPPQTYINNLTPHPPPRKPEGPKIKAEAEEAPISPIRSPHLPLVPQTHPIAFKPCLSGCFSTYTVGEIAHYYRSSEHDSAAFCFRPGVPTYDTLPTTSSCKVVILTGGKWLNELSTYHEHVRWQPCWVITSAATTQPFLSLSSVPHVTAKLVKTYSRGGEDRTGKWEPGSGIVVERYPRLVPKAWLHQIQDGKRVALTKLSCTRLKVVFNHRSEIETDEDLVKCLQKAKY